MAPKVGGSGQNGLAGRPEPACREGAGQAEDGQQPTLDPAKVTGKIVQCDRGTVARVDKSAAVKLAGGVGMIQTNTSAAQSLNADFHSLPSIHLAADYRQPILTYIATAGASATATISEVDPSPVDAPTMAGFSSYGPALAGEGDLIKPDIERSEQLILHDHRLVDLIAAYREIRPK